ncbi:hypothetical protein [Burkholderia sp. IT-111MI5]|uniref:hypothetical protein n=1 Tax=Burkholderia sp. IT-111MI5 TaxID=3026439 RepID=UPI0039E0FFF0
MPAQQAESHSRVAQGIARHRISRSAVQCRGTRACPVTGVWQASATDDHRRAATFNQWYRQACVMRGDTFPDPRAMHLDVSPADVTWMWWNEANRFGFAKLPQVSDRKSAMTQFALLYPERFNIGI